MKQLYKLLFVLMSCEATFMGNAQNVGINTTTPNNQLQIGDAPGFTGNHLAIGNGAQGMSFFQGNASSVWFTNTNFALMPVGSNGLLGLGTPTPAYNLDVYGSNPQINLTASGNAATALLSRYSNRFEINPSDAFQISVGAVGIPHFWIGANGYIGMGTTAPGNKLEIGSVGSSGFSGNDIAFGNGTQASGIAQTPSVAWWYSTTDIALMPKGTGHGRVGINTTTPGYPLEVDDYVSGRTGLYTYINDKNPGKILAGDITPEVSIFASANVDAAEFDAASDIRIKNVKGITDTKADLATIRAIHITNYTLRDKIKNGDRPFKKVIAQQVEQVYPQVITKHTDFIPNVYQLVRTVEKSDSAYILYFDSAHHITAQAKTLKLFTEGDHLMRKCSIISIPSDSQVIVKLDQWNGGKLFVYGEEVNDFQTVDYEGLSTLNISATQELSKVLDAQKKFIVSQAQEIELLNKKIDALGAAVELLKKKE